MCLKTIEVIPRIKDIEYEWNFISNYDIVSKYLPLIPARTKYSLAINFFDLKTDPGLNDRLRMLNWNDKRIDSIECVAVQQLNIFNKTEKRFKFYS